MTARQIAARVLVALCACALMALAHVRIAADADGVDVRPLAVGDLPARVFRPAGGPPGPAVVIAHGFAGSQQLMQAFALSLARNGYTAVTFDFAGHGRNVRPLGGSITREDGATRRLVDEVAEVAAAARPLGDGRLAVLGHSMASDIVIRFAQAHPDVAATIAVSMFSPVVTAQSPRNLLVIVGDWEGMLKAEALRVVGLTPPAPGAVDPPRAGETRGDVAAGTARRAAFSPHVEHVGVLFSAASLREAVTWLDGVFAVRRDGPPPVAARGPWILALLAGAVALAWPLSALLPRVRGRPAGLGLRWREAWLLAVPMIAAPLVLTVAPTRFLPVLVGDYLAAHFAAYGVITGLCCLWLLKRRQPPPSAPVRPVAFAAALCAVLAFVAAALFWPIDGHVTSFIAGGPRIALSLAMLAGTLPYFLANEWLTRGAGAGRGVYAASCAAFLVSLGIAVSLDFGRLFFLLIIVPVIVPFMLVFGLFSAWIGRRTGDPLVAGTANAVAFAWAIGMTFPLLQTA